MIGTEEQRDGAGVVGRRGGKERGLQRLRCGISIQGRIRERLFYKDGQIELRRRSTRRMGVEKDSEGRERGGRGRG